jgi:single-strand DNA-binding protein
MHSRTILLGNLGRDAELRYTNSGKAVCDFSMATNRKYNNSSGEKVTETTWWKVTIWNALAEAIHMYLKSGMLVYIEGTIKPDEGGNPRIWQTKDGDPAASFELTADVVRLCSKSSHEEGDEPPNANQVYKNQIPGPNSSQIVIPF